MNRDLIELWADIGSEDYWPGISSRREFVPFKERWPQPGFVGERYFQTAPRIVVMGQNPRASNTPRASAGDAEMFRLIREHARLRSADSLNALFAMMRNFMLGIGYEAAWRPITAVTRHLGLKLNDIAYLNLIPLATRGDAIVSFREPFERATAKQLEVLAPAKIVSFGKGAYEQFTELGRGRWKADYVEQRDLSRAGQVRGWLSEMELPEGAGRISSG